MSGEVKFDAHAQRCGCHNAATVNDTEDVVAVRGWICIGNHTHPFVDKPCAALRRAISAELLKRAIDTAETVDAWWREKGKRGQTQANEYILKLRAQADALDRGER